MDLERPKPDRNNLRAERVISFSIAGAGLLLLTGALLLPSIYPSPEDYEAMRMMAVLFGLGSTCVGLALYAASKGRSPAWGFLGFGHVLGVIVLHYLPGSCRACGSRAPAGARDCPPCGGPL
jgi:hypothetical protein